LAPFSAIKILEGKLILIGVIFFGDADSPNVSLDYHFGFFGEIPQLIPGTTNRNLTGHTRELLGNSFVANRARYIVYLDVLILLLLPLRFPRFFAS
jgi:hypothetical protein